MNIRNFFRKRTTPRPAREGQGEGLLPLCIEGIGQALLTPEPDDAELAAQALLEMLSLPPDTSHRGGAKKHHGKHKDTDPTPGPSPTREGSAYGQDGAAAPRPSEGRGRGGVEAADAAHDARYYKHLAEKIRQTSEHQRLRVTRFLAFVEQELRKRHLPVYGDGSLGLLEAELRKRMGIVDREGGELKHRWQNCLADVTVRLMKAAHDGDGAPTITEPGGNEGD